MNVLRYISVSLLIFFLGFLANQFFHKSFFRQDVLGTSKSCRYRLINQLRCEPDLAKKKKEFISLRNELMQYIEQKKAERKVQDVSVYFRDLQNGPIMGINAGENYTPASLLKLPLMISFYKKAESDPGILTKKIQVSQTITGLSQNVQPLEKAKAGSEYTIDELIKILITESDNTSGQTLFAYLDQAYPQENLIFTLSDLGIIDPRKSVDEQYVTASSYASIFRILYNSSYLNLEMSNKALDLLTQSEYKDGLVAGVPADVLVAHKFGERKRDNEQQLHDCGIIYYPENPYLLCIMTKGTSTADLSPIIKDISQEVYKEVQERN